MHPTLPIYCVNANDCISLRMQKQAGLVRSNGYHDSSPRSAPSSFSTSSLFALACLPVHSSSPTLSTQSPSPSQLCQSSFDRGSASVPAGLVSDQGSGEFSAGSMGEWGRREAGDGRWRDEETMLREEGGGDTPLRGLLGAGPVAVRVGD